MESFTELLHFVEKVMKFFTSPSRTLKMEVMSQGLAMMNALRCLQYRDSLTSGLQRLQTEDCLTDITIKVDGKVFHAHRCVLAAVSSYFEVMFSHGFQESSQQEIELQAVDGHIFELLLNFAYNGKMEDLSVETTIDAFKAALYLQFPLAQDACTGFMSKKVKEDGTSPHDILSVLLIAEEHDKSELSEKCSEELLKTDNFLQVMVTDVFRERAPSELINRFLRRIDISYDTSEEQLLCHIIQWLKYDWENRQEHAANFLKQLRLGLIPEDNVKELIDAEILELPNCKEIMTVLMHNNEKFAAEDDVALLPETFLPRSFTRTLVCIGGQGQPPVSFLDKDTQCWTALEKFPEIPRGQSIFARFLSPPQLCYHSSLVVNGDIYVAGGRGHGPEAAPDDNRFLKFDRMSYTWQQLPCMSSDRMVFQLVHLDGFIYAVGGFGSDSVLDTAERFNMATNIWDQTYTLPERMTCPSAVVFNGKLLVYGGIDSIRTTEDNIINVNVLLVFDPTTQEWSKVLEEQLPMPNVDPYITCVLVVHDGDCFRVWYEERYRDDTKSEVYLIPHVNRIDTRMLRNGALRASIGNEISNQTAIPESGSYAFHIDGQVYVNMSRCVHKTGLTIESGEDLNVEAWNDCWQGSLSVVEFTLDLSRVT